MARERERSVDVTLIILIIAMKKNPALSQHCIRSPNYFSKVFWKVVSGQVLDFRFIYKDTEDNSDGRNINFQHEVHSYSPPHRSLYRSGFR